MVWGYLARAFPVLKLMLTTSSLLTVLFGGGAGYYMWGRGEPGGRFPHAVLAR